jgi:hypothetical protein
MIDECACTWRWLFFQNEVAGERVRGVDVEVEQHGGLQAECGGRGGRAHAGGTGAACCCDVWGLYRLQQGSLTQAWCYDGAVVS